MNKKEKELLDQLAAKIKLRRQELNLTQEKLADICEFDRTYISLLERAKRNPSIFNLKKLSLGLKTNLSELLKNI